jgi:hypothetical protein
VESGRSAVIAKESRRDRYGQEERTHGYANENGLEQARADRPMTQPSGGGGPFAIDNPCTQTGASVFCDPCASFAVSQLSRALICGFVGHRPGSHDAPRGALTHVLAPHPRGHTVGEEAVTSTNWVCDFEQQEA